MENSLIEIPSYLEYDIEHYDRKTDLSKVALCMHMLEIYKEEINKIQNNCKHVVQESSFYNRGHFVVAGGISDCPKCNIKIDGWYCPKSKDHKCDYKQKSGEYDHDQCRFCGHPEERK